MKRSVFLETYPGGPRNKSWQLQLLEFVAKVVNSKGAASEFRRKGCHSFACVCLCALFCVGFGCIFQLTNIFLNTVCVDLCLKTFKTLNFKKSKHVVFMKIIRALKI